MKSNRLGTLPMVALSLCICSSPLLAQEPQSQQSKPQSMRIPRWDAQTATQKHGTGLLLTGDLLIWRAHEENLDTCVTATDNMPSFGVFETVTIESGSPSWSAGSKVGIGYLTSHDDWAFDLRWTRFHPSNTTKNVTAQDGFLLGQAQFGQSVNGNNGSVYGAFTSSWSLNYDTIDLMVHRPFSLTKYLILTPMVGMQSAWIRQKFVPTGFFGAGNASFIKNKLKNNFWGLGLAGGLGTDWRFGPHFSFYGNALGSLIWGPVKTSQHGSGNFTAVLYNSPLTTTRRSFHAMQGSIDLEFGFAANFSFNRDKMECIFKFGWEEVIWFNQNQLYASSSYNDVSLYTVHGDLGLSGFILGLQFKL